MATLEELEESYERGRLSYLVGAGASVAAGLPDTATLERRLLSLSLAEDPHLRHLCEEETATSAIVLAFTRRFGPGAIVEDVQRRVYDSAGSRDEGDRRLGELLRSALYAGTREVGPGPIQHELAAAALDGSRPGRPDVLALAIDDLLELALAAAGARRTRVIAAPDAMAAQETSPAVIHLHGSMPRGGTARGAVIASGRDAAAHAAWTDEVLEHLVARDQDLLLVGVGPNEVGLAQLLAARRRLSGRGPVARLFAITGARAMALSAGGDVSSRFAERMAAAAEPSVWRGCDVEPIVVGHEDLVAASLRRIRLGPDPAGWAARGSKWLVGKRAYEGLYDEKRQKAAHGLFRSMARHLRSRFSVGREEEIHVGVHVPALDDPRWLRIAFHFVGEQDGMSLLPNLLTETLARQRELSIGGPGEPEGATGCAFVTGNVVGSHVGERKLHENFSPEKAERWQGPRTFQSLLAVPAYVVEAGYVPVGVMYLDSNRKTPFWEALDADDYRDLCAFCATMCVSMLRAD